VGPALGHWAFSGVISTREGFFCRQAPKIPYLYKRNNKKILPICAEVWVPSLGRLMQEMEAGKILKKWMFEKMSTAPMGNQTPAGKN
jgi:hypothetical protein